MNRRAHSSATAAADTLNGIPAIAWHITMAGAGIGFNQYFQDFTGHDATALKGSGWHGVIHADDRAQVTAQCADATTLTRTFDCRLQRADGEFRWLRVHVAALSHGLLTATASDISDLIAAQTELALQRQIFDQIPAFIVVKDDANNMLRVNRAGGTYFGGAEAATNIEGRNTYDFFSHDVARAWHEQDRAVIASGAPLLGVVEALKVDGVTKWHRMDKVPFTRADGAILCLVTGIDITDAKNFEHRLREQVEDSDALVRVLRQREYEQNLILDHIPVMILYKDTDNRILRANKFAADVLGYQIGEIEGRHASLCLPAEATALYRHDLDVLRSRMPQMNAIEPITTRRGERRWLRLHHLPCFDATGALTRIIMVGEDITAARQLESDLHERVAQSERLVTELASQYYEQRLIFDHIPARIIYTDTRNRVLRSNLYGAAYIGLSVEDFEGHHLREIYGDQADVYYTDDLEVIRSKRPLSIGLQRVPLADGSVRWERTEKVPLLDANGEVSGIIMLSIDVTAQKLAEDEVRRREQEFRLILDNTPAMIIFRDADGTVLRANRLACDYFKVPADAIEGRNLRELSPTYADAWIAEERAVMLTGTPLRKLNLQYADANGVMRWWRTDKVPYYNEHGVATGVVIIVHDITEQKAIEDELRRQKAEIQILADK